jgi:hypothetical protein
MLASVDERPTDPGLESGHLLQRQGMREIADNVVDRAVDSFNVVCGNGTLGFLVSSQDLASGFCGSLASYRDWRIFV